MDGNDVWFNHISIEKNEQYIKLLLNEFNIKKYNITFHNEFLSLFLNYKMDSYRCDIDKEHKQLVLLKRNLCCNNRKDKFHVVCRYNGLDVWREAFKLITKNKEYI